MKYMRIYEEHEDIEDILSIYSDMIKDPFINSDGTVDAQSVLLNLETPKLTKIPLQFRKTGDFYINSNKITSLKGCPVECSEFMCSDNRLTSLKYSPRIVNGRFDCQGNQITSLIGGPEIVKMDYNFYGNNVVDFKGFPKEFDFKQTISCFDNPLKEIVYLCMEITYRRKFISYLIKFDVIDGYKVDETRLDQAFYTSTGKKLSSKRKESLSKYQLI